MDNDVVIITACDQRYFPYCVDLLMSIQSVCGVIPRMRVLDVGMLPGQAQALANIVEKIVVPDWDLGNTMELPAWYRAMMARPFLPKYSGDASIVAWLDSDIWIQRMAPLQSLIEAARDGVIAVVEEQQSGKGFIADGRPVNGQAVRIDTSLQIAKENVRLAYENCFGPEIASAFGALPCFNDGVFALRADSPSWRIWQEIYANAFSRPFNLLVEQLSLNVGIRQGLVPFSKQPPEANYTCHIELPWYSAAGNVFTIPEDKSRVIGTVHLVETKSCPLLPIPQFPDGKPEQMPIDYRSLDRFLGAKPGFPKQA